jgi:hypothetical protein
LTVDGERRASEEGFKLLFPMAPFEGIDVGIDRRSPVSFALRRRRGTFAFDGTLHHVHYAPGEPAPDSLMEMADVLREIALTYD